MKLLRSNSSYTFSNTTERENYRHSFWRISLIITSTIVFALAYYHTILKLNKHTNEINHTKWLVVTSVFISIWQVIWLVYGLLSIIRKSASDFFYKYPPVMHSIIYINFMAANVLSFFAYLLWIERVYLLTSCYLLLSCISIYIAVAVCVFKLFDYQREMTFTEQHVDIWLIRILVQNGLVLYACWCFMLVTLSLRSFLANYFTHDNALSITLLLLTCKMIFYFIIENFAAYKYCKFLFMPSILYITFFNCISFAHTTHAINNFNFLLQISLIGLSIGLFLFKIFIFISREFHYHKRISNQF